MNYFKEIIVLFLTLNCLFHVVCSVVELSDSEKAILHRIIKDQKNCWEKISMKFGNTSDSIGHAQYAFDSFTNKNNDFSKDELSYYNLLYNRLYLTVVMDPNKFCKRRIYQYETSNSDCEHEIHNFFIDIDKKLILTIVKDLFFNHRRQSYLYREVNKIKMFSVDANNYWDYLKTGLRLDKFPSLEDFCKSVHPINKKYLENYVQ